ncbi:hypothetical protein [Actinomadura rubrisoli]|uniref:Uncharacterized protein n=1 Tax=Actinomadura rubrisoli TaxID=2530368 RepID=A0A4R5B2E2_9ACTN|nr:hypothetical protein [Actinomadura rubrisoli]TDD77724.1 hypothetical protein E1298_29795 [Actinomadura rubrisoli]
MTSTAPEAEAAARSVARAHDLPATDRAIRDLREAETLVPFLALLRDPRAHRPWREAALDATARAELDYAARIELAERAEDSPGEHKDAARADILDALSGVLWRAQDLAAYVSRAVYCPVLPEAGPAADPRPYLRRAARYLPAAVAGWPNGKDLAYFAADYAAEILTDLERALALVPDGHVVKALCPWCRGGLAGAYTWRVRIVPGGEPAIMCESGLCQPASKDVTTWWAGVPVWPMRDWPWLARRLAHLDRRRAARTRPVVRSTAQGATGRAGAPFTPAAEADLLDGRLDWDGNPSTDRKALDESKE